MNSNDISLRQPVIAGPRRWEIDPALWLLVAANLLPLYGAVCGGWSVLSILLVYWAENVIVGGLTVLEMFTVIVNRPACTRWVLIDPRMVFFCCHFGLFTLAHGALIYAMFGDGPFAHGAVRHEYWPYLYAPFLPGHALFYAAVSILLAHLNGYRANFIGRGEFRSTTIDALMFRPYARVVVLHVVLLLGGFLALRTGSNIAALALLVVIKTSIELALYTRSRAAVAAAARNG